jgi:hypothetical protein
LKLKENAMKEHKFRNKNVSLNQKIEKYSWKRLLNFI